MTSLTERLRNRVHDSHMDTERLMDEAIEELGLLLRALEAMTSHYVTLAGCGDCGFWDPEKEDEVIAARAVIAKARGND